MFVDSLEQLGPVRLRPRRQLDPSRPDLGRSMLDVRHPYAEPVNDVVAKPLCPDSKAILNHKLLRRLARLAPTLNRSWNWTWFQAYANPFISDT